MSEAEEKLLNIGRIKRSGVKGKAEKPAAGAKKRGRPPKPKKEEIVFDDEPQFEMPPPDNTDDPDVSQQEPEDTPADFSKRVQMCSIIEDLKEKMGAIGR